MYLLQFQCLILACGNPLRGDDGLGPWLADWAERRFAGDPNVQVLSSQQWTPELAEDIARAHFVVFLDSSVASLPGTITLTPVQPANSARGLATHHLGAPELLALASKLYNSLPETAQLLTIGVTTTELGEALSPVVTAAFPQACRLIEETVLRLLNGTPSSNIQT